nr:hypothetical protein [Tanacetum cinerariifolium]
LKWIWRTATAVVVEMVVTWCGGSEVVLAVVMTPVGMSHCCGDEWRLCPMWWQRGFGVEGGSGGFVVTVVMMVDMVTGKWPEMLKWIWRTAAAAVVEMVVTWCGGSEVVLAVVMTPVRLSRCRGDEWRLWPLWWQRGKGSDALIIKDWVSDDEEETVEKKEVKPIINRINFVKATTDNNPKEPVKNEQLQRKDNIIGKLKAHINNMKVVSTCPSLSTLEIENTQLKDELTTIRIKNDSLRDENVSIKARFQELYKSKAGSNSSVSSGATIHVKPKAVASGLYAMTPKYVPPLKRINKETNSSLPRKEIVTVVDLSNVLVNLPTGIKSVPDASKSKSKSDKKIHKNFPARSKKVKRVAKPLRNLNKKNRVDSSLNDKCTGFISKSVSVCKTCNECLVFGNHDECVVKSMNEKKPKVINNANVKKV